MIFLYSLSRVACPVAGITPGDRPKIISRAADYLQRGDIPPFLLKNQRVRPIFSSLKMRASISLTFLMMGLNAM